VIASEGASICVEVGSSGPSAVGCLHHSDGYSTLPARRADGRLDDHIPSESKRGGSLVDFSSVPGKVSSQADIAELVARSRLEVVAEERRKAFGSDVAIEMRNLAVVKDHWNPWRNRLTAYGTELIMLAHRSGDTKGLEDGWQWILLSNFCDPATC
jgi:hypothetical protein